MGDDNDGVWPMDIHDLDWLVELADRRRASLTPHAPRFWRPAQDASVLHRAHLASLLDDDAALALRSRRGYLIALDHGDRWLVDDAGVTPDGDWEVDGVRLLEYAEEVCGPLRFVVPVFEIDRMSAARAVGLFPAEHWWHRDLEPTGPVRTAPDSDLGVAGATSRLVPAPPVYDPGGPVVLITEVYAADALHLVEDAAAERGATVAVVTQRPEQFELAGLLEGAGYTLTTAFCEAGPGAGHPLARGATEV